MLILYDSKNQKARDVFEKVNSLKLDLPLIVVIGGDGFMLETIHSYHKEKIPFFGINAGHKGYLLNEINQAIKFLSSNKSFPEIYDLPLLNGTFTLSNNTTQNHLAFTDIYLERASSQTGWLKIKINRKICIKLMMSDGALVATPAGSSAYAKSMGASPLPISAKALILAGSNVYQPHGFKSCNLPFNHKVILEVIDPKNRPFFGVYDGIRVGEVKKVCISVSKETVQLAFIKGMDPYAKLLSIQFPQKTSSIVL